jgi:hypothetical protein
MLDENEVPNYKVVRKLSLIDYDGVRLCLRTAATNDPIVHPPGDMSMERNGDDDDASWG